MGGRGASSTSKGNRSSAAPMTPEQAMAATNPNYVLGPEWQNNCQRCVYAYEMNRRGVLCEAKPRLMDGGRTSRNDEVASNWRNVMEGQTWDQVGSRSQGKTVSNLDSAMASYGEGSRAVVYVTWKGGRSAHVFNAERVGNHTEYFDAQTGRRVDINEYIGQSMPTRTMVSRIDNLVPNPRYIEGCITRR